MEPYEIIVDTARRTLRVLLNGFWDVATASEYLAELATAGRRISRGGLPNWWLIDLGHFQVQSREVAELMGQRLPTLFSPATIVAIVASARLSLIQARRVVPNDRHRHFDTRAEAERWLSEHGMPT